jgi:hypothetical protein
VLPGWSEREPGELDIIEVGRSLEGCGVEGWFVPFRVVRLDGSEFRSTACVVPPRIVELTDRVGSSFPVLPSEGGPPIGSVGRSAWLYALAAGGALLVLSETSMRLARRRRS